MKMNTIRQSQLGEPASEGRSFGAQKRQSDGAQETEAPMEDAIVVGGSRSGKDRVVNAGDLPGQEAARPPAGVRAAIVAQASRGKTEDGNTVTTEPSRVTTGGAKGGRKANPQSAGEREANSPRVPSQADKQGEEDLWQRCKAERGVWSERMLVALERGVKGNQWFSLIDKVFRDRTLELAWAKVHSNAGACGVDGITVERFAKDSHARLLAVKEHLERGSYQPKPVKRVWIPKPGSPEKRALGIPTVRDRVVQCALQMVVEPIFEREFAPQSYGFRPGRSCRDALRRVEELLQSGHCHVVEIDIKGYFDAIPQECLLERVGECIADGRVLGLIGVFLKARVMEGMKGWETETGTPQGGVISPLLANIYLNPLDWLLKRAGLEMVRYADDMIVLCREGKSARQALAAIQRWMSEAGLELNGDKTRINDMTGRGSHFDFLGYRFWRGKSGKVRRFVRPKSRKKLRERIKLLTLRANGQSLEAIIGAVNPILRGWYGYFKHVSTEALGETDGWVRGRLRSILRQRRNGQGRARGKDHQRWGNGYFEALGLFGLERAQGEELTSLREGVTC